MTIANLALWFAGVALIAIGFSRAQGPYRRYQALRENDQNIRRYEEWRGARRSDTGRDEVTGADVMRRMLSDQARKWSLLVVVGFILVFAGFAIR